MEWWNKGHTIPFPPPFHYSSIPTLFYLPLLTVIVKINPYSN